MTLSDFNQVELKILMKECSKKNSIRMISIIFKKFIKWLFSNFNSIILILELLSELSD